MKRLSLRFDIDTHVCARDGVPKLLELAERRAVPFTFFVACGKSVYHPDVIRRMFSGGDKSEVETHHFSALHKLGPWEYLVAAAFNPSVLVGEGRENIARAGKQGHELALHGGHNHGEWMAHAPQWPSAKIRGEIEWGLQQLRELGFEPEGFGSPGGVWTPAIHAELKSAGFKYIADVLGPGRVEIREGVVHVPTVGCGPGNVAYLENLRARGCSTDQILENFRALLKNNDTVVVYDHPYFAGLREIRTLERMLDLANESGFKVVPMKQIADLAKSS